MSLRGGVNLIVLLILVPLLSKLLLWLKMNPAMKDLRLSQGSGLLLTVGSIIMFLAPVPAILILGLVIFALGSTFHLTARSLVTSLVVSDHVATLYSAIAVVTSGGMLVAGPLLANTYRWGMQLGENWIGLPFLVAASLYLLALLAISFVKLKIERDETSLPPEEATQ
jgi:MFS family permease